MSRRGFDQAFALFSLAFPLAACDSSSPTPTPPPNRAPTISSAATATVVENASLGFQIAATDADGDTLSYSLAGADAALFKIDAAGLLNFLTAPNFEAPGDSNRDNVYNVTVTVSDGKTSSSQAISVTVQNSLEGISLHRVATGLGNTVSFGFYSPNYYLVQRDGTLMVGTPGRDGVVASTLLQQALPDLAPNGMISAYIASSVRFFDNLRVLYIDTSQRLVVRYFYAGIMIRGSCSAVVLPHVDKPLEITGWVDGNYVAVGATQTGLPSNLAQDPTSNIGKLLRFRFGTIDPCTNFGLDLAASGLHDVRGIVGAGRGGQRVISDHGSGVAEELNLLNYPGTGIVNFGWPFREGTQTLNGTPSAGLVDPLSSYAATGPVSIGSNIVSGQFYTPNTIASLAGKYVFADRDSGAIFTVPTTSIELGQTFAPGSYENRVLDFKPAVGSLAHPMLMGWAGVSWTTDSLYILDQGGDLFVVRTP